jgi:hypothetical protein
MNYFAGWTNSLGGRLLVIFAAFIFLIPFVVFFGYLLNKIRHSYGSRKIKYIVFTVLLAIITFGFLPYQLGHQQCYREMMAQNYELKFNNETDSYETVRKSSVSKLPFYCSLYLDLEEPSLKN